MKREYKPVFRVTYLIQGYKTYMNAYIIYVKALNNGFVRFSGL